MTSTVTTRCTGTPDHSAVESLADFFASHRGLVVLTGAGISTASGIGDYRDHDGAWKKAQPIDYRDFVRTHSARQRYWLRSMIGWPMFGRAQPNAAHRSLRKLEADGYVQLVITQNVDGLHQRAGQQRIVDLHGQLANVVCLDCGHTIRRDSLQDRLTSDNPRFADLHAPGAPDGDALLEDAPFEQFAVPDCSRCGGMLKPDVVFYGESVPRSRVDQAFAAVAKAPALLIAGSSLMVFSGFRFAREASRAAKPIGAVNLGVTRADALLDLKIPAPCEQVLPQLTERLGL